MIINQYILI